MSDYRLYIRDILDVRDILDGMGTVQEFVRGMDYVEFICDDKTSSAVFRKLVVIGEAAKNIPDAIRNQYSQIPWQQLIGLGDDLLDKYYDLNSKLVWDTVKDLMPSVQSSIEKILDESEIVSESDVINIT